MTTVSANDSNRMESKKKLFRIIYGFWQSQCLYVITRLGIPNLLQEDSQTVESLAEKTSTQVDRLYLLLRAMAHLGVLKEQPERVFSSTELSKLLVINDPEPSMGNLVMHLMEPCMWEAWNKLETGLKTGETPFDQANGMSLYEFMKDNPQSNDLFNNAMSFVTAHVVDSLLEVYDFSRFNTIMDVGGSLGELISRIVTTFGVKGILFDLPHVVEKAPAFLSKQGLDKDAVRVIGGDAFTSLPQGADAIIMKHFISSWNDEQAMQILRRCQEALPIHGKVVILQTLIPPLGAPVESPDGIIPAMTAVRMMVTNPGGYLRMEQDYKDLFEASGFKLEKVVHTKTHLSAMEFALA